MKIAQILNTPRYLFLVTLLLFFGCAQALPRTDEKHLTAESLQATEQAALKAQAAAKEAREERERAQSILQEAQTIARQTKEAQKRCEASVRELTKRKKKRAITRILREPPLAQPTSAPTNVVETRPTGDPEYSKSDAPIEHKPTAEHTTMEHKPVEPKPSVEVKHPTENAHAAEEKHPVENKH